MEAPRRLARLPARVLEGGIRLARARSLRARTLGLALLDELPAGHALLIPNCRCVHTFGMRFALDLVFVHADGTVARVVRELPRRRVVRCARARHVVEVAAGGADAVLTGNILGGP